ncbi:MAG: ATP phosphoribosyltransferase regulatory subunit [Anaerolineae bacterium]|nr:ATP phosphoribosyltransferase regulatory subunit [Anaerolineae bacterium]MDW8069295.1 ATP phosphoribosyltransferase regulatory subunit [Anaerolineae bacterium]
MATDRPSLRGHLPHGVQDLFLSEASRRRQAEAVLRDLFARWAYRELIPPTFEYEDTLVIGAGSDLRQAMYRFFDREGHTLALRADFTTQVARMAATKLLDQPLPLRCFYIGSVFRYEEPQVGHQREFTQAGVELIGASTPAADAEVVALAAAALEALDVPNFQIILGQMALFRALTAGLRADDLERIRAAIDQRNPFRLQKALDAAGMTGSQRALLASLPERIGGPEVLEEALAFGGAVASAAEALAEVYRLLDAYGIAGRVILDLGEVRGMDYYTGITFRGVAPGLGWPLLSGGRYDELLGQFGRPLAAVGFGLGIERALLAQAPQTCFAPSLAPHLVVQGCIHPPCLSLVRRLRQAGYRVEVDVLGRQGADLRAYAHSQGCRRTLHCTGDSGPQGPLWQFSDERGERTVTGDQLWEEAKKWND